MTRVLPVQAGLTEPLASVLRVLQLTPAATPPAAEASGVRPVGLPTDAFTATSLPQVGGRVYGGQVLAQGLLAAAATIVEDADGPRLPNSVHAVFLRPGELDQPITLEVERLHDGRSFTRRRTHALQGGEPILSMITSFQETQPGPSFALTAPEVPGPQELTSALEIFRTIDHPVAKFLGKTAAFDTRHIDEALYVRHSCPPATSQALWMRPRGQVPQGLGQTVARALMLYACDQIMLEPVLRGHGLGWLAPGLSLATLDHAMWFHRDIDITDWHLYVQSAPSAVGGRGLGRAEVFNTAGQHVASIAQEGMVRVPGDDAAHVERANFLEG
ncbi:acyl-CoA thioesterase [Buchananella hordeovulneris]|uniref:Acyl-CoA thioesterase II n=1 Tax=Buchananella hordeovulneris TaxID=52770 RepID=A0A1Q5PX47_9ACTO|nr:acyl-CoA thioesterase domain-containing protein [Buchananella hordeovulneris]OKL52076.1 acyl-CoA thioesterase II [Buchananella hordeovulneris]